MCDTKPGVRIRKDEARVEALGALDELNSYIGYCRVMTVHEEDKAICLAVQHDLFTVQAQLAGSDKFLPAMRVKEIERAVDSIEQVVPLIKSFCVLGQTQLSACFDVSRTLARKAERRVIAAGEAQNLRFDEVTLAYLNRLSSLLYALARRANHRAGVAEIVPKYYDAPQYQEIARD